MKKKLLIFDLDGTIADTIYSIRDGVNLAMDNHGMPRKSYEEIRVAIGTGARALIKRCMPDDKRQDEKLFEAVFADYDRFYEQTYANIDGCYEGMSEAMHTLYERGYILAVLSNKQDAYVKKIIEMLFPDGIVSFASGQTELPTKPDPTVPLMIAGRFGAAAGDCAFIGDSEVDVKTAKNAGMMAVACPWGYRPRESLADADVILERPLGLLDIFE